MANLRVAMDAAFWDVNIPTPQSLDGISRSIPGEPVPGASASKVLRVQQLSFLGNGFPLGIIPSYSPSADHGELGSFALQSLLGKLTAENWWVAVVGQFRPRKLISSIKAEITAADEWEPSLIKDVTRHFLDKSLYAIGLFSQIAFAPASSLLLSTEKHGERRQARTRAALFHKLPDHDITLEAAWPELFVDGKGRYWNVPESVSLDFSSLISESGLRYRFGIHKNNGTPKAFDSVNVEAPLALLPGICAKAAVSYAKSKDIWRQTQTEIQEDVPAEKEKDRYWPSTYDVRLKEPHAAISGIAGATCHAWLASTKTKDRGRLAADLFGSLCYTFQHGKFTEDFGDLTRLDARLDIASASAIAKRVSNIFRNPENYQSPGVLSSPRLCLIFQQQVAGPIIARVDTKFSLGSSSGRHGLELEDLKYSLSYSLRLLQSGKVVAWYSPFRKEGMIELRLFEF